jgi:hypothetical protein
MSAKRAVTVLRSPSAMAAVCADEIVKLADPGDDADDWSMALPGESELPQSAQNRLLGGFSASHLGQRLVNGAPQSPQNFLPLGLSLPHFEQRINSHSK